MPSISATESARRSRDQASALVDFGGLTQTEGEWIAELLASRSVHETALLSERSTSTTCTGSQGSCLRRQGKRLQFSHLDGASAHHSSVVRRRAHVDGDLIGASNANPSAASTRRQGLTDDILPLVPDLRAAKRPRRRIRSIDLDRLRLNTRCLPSQATPIAPTRSQAPAWTFCGRHRLDSPGKCRRYPPSSGAPRRAKPRDAGSVHGLIGTEAGAGSIPTGGRPPLP